MAPLLSIPTAVKELLYRYGMLYMIPILGLYGCTIACAALASKRLIPRVSSRPRRSCPALTVSSVGGTCMPSSLLIKQRIHDDDCPAARSETHGHHPPVSPRLISSAVTLTDH